MAAWLIRDSRGHMLYFKTVSPRVELDGRKIFPVSGPRRQATRHSVLQANILSSLVFQVFGVLVSPVQFALLFFLIVNKP